MIKFKNDRLINIKSGIYLKGTITLDSIVQSLKKHPQIKEAGAILTFTGIVREKSIDGKPVKAMLIDAYEEVANKSIEKICTELKQSEEIIELIIVHLKGEFNLSEELVHVVVASSHREEGFKALEVAVERYKKEIAVWKKEIYYNGTSRWIH
ncbi:MAG: molybdenum cofactor biosynthesis protein MoaE [Promethearchaeota archaeon]